MVAAPRNRGAGRTGWTRTRFEAFIANNGPVDAVGHRIVHGGQSSRRPFWSTLTWSAAWRLLTDLAPLHQPKSLRAWKWSAGSSPDVPAVACFDTAFHATIPAAAATYALPAQWRRRWDLRRFGFHGLPTPTRHAPSRRSWWGTATGSGDRRTLRVVTCHLGAGASLAAVREGVSVDTTMGFTPLEGLVMATRSGSVDPGLVLWLEEHVGMPPSELASTLEHRSGLLGLTGTATCGMCWRPKRPATPSRPRRWASTSTGSRAGIAAMVAALGGLDAWSSPAGWGRTSAPVRWRAAEGLGFLGVQVDRAANESRQRGGQPGAPPARGPPTREPRATGT